MTTALAFDQATTTGHSFGGTNIPLDRWISGHFRALKRPLEGERLVLIEDEALKLIDLYKPDLVIYEEPWNPMYSMMQAARAGKAQRQNVANPETLAFLEHVKAAILMAAARRSVPTEGYAPRTWRSALKLPSAPRLTLEDIKAKAEIADPETAPKRDPNFIKKLTLEAVRRLGAKVATYDESDSWGLLFYALHGKAGAARAQDDLLARVKSASNM